MLGALRRWSPAYLGLIAIAIIGLLVLSRLWGTALEFDSQYYFSALDLDERQISKEHSFWAENPHQEYKWLRVGGDEVFFLLYQVLGRGPGAYYLVIVAMFAGFVMATGSLLRRMLPWSIAAVATLAIVADDIHSEIFFFWASDAHALPAAILGVLGLIAHVRWRQGWRPGLWLAVGIWIAGFATSEMFLGSLAFVLAFELCGYPVREHRIRGVLPAAALSIAYVAFYKLGGFGGWNFAHPDPTKDPLSAFGILAENIPFLVENAAFGTDTLGLWASALALAAALPFVVQGIRAQSSEHARAICGLMLGGIMSTAVGITNIWRASDEWVSDRLLLFFSVGVAVFWVVALLQAITWARSGLHRAVRLGSAVMAGAIVALLFVWSPLRLTKRLDIAVTFLDSAHQPGVKTLRAGLRLCEGNHKIVWLRSDVYGEMMVAFMGDAVAPGTPWRPPFVVVPGGKPEGTLVRVDERTLDIRDAHAAGSPYDPYRPPLGARIPVEGIVSAVIEVVERTDTTARIRVTFSEDPAAYCIVTQRDDQVTKVSLPAVGGTLQF